MFHSFQFHIVEDTNKEGKYNNLGCNYAKYGKYNKAIEMFKKALQIKTDYSIAFYNWGLTLYKDKNYEEAIEKFKIAAKIEPDEPDVYNDWGISLAKLKRYKESIEKYKTAIEKNNTHHFAYYNWGKTLCSIGKFEEAVEKFQKAIEIYPKFDLAYEAFKDLYDKGYGREKNLKLIDSFKKLEYNWNGYGAPPLDKKLIDHCKIMITSPFLRFQPKIFPTARNSIQFEYEKYDGSYLEFEIYSDTISYYYIDVNGKEKESEGLTWEDLFNQIENYVTR